MQQIHKFGFYETKFKFEFNSNVNPRVIGRGSRGMDKGPMVLISCMSIICLEIITYLSPLSVESAESN